MPCLLTSTCTRLIAKDGSKKSLSSQMIRSNCPPAHARHHTYNLMALTLPLSWRERCDDDDDGGGGGGVGVGNDDDDDNDYNDM